jgi:Rad51
LNASTVPLSASVAKFRGEDYGRARYDVKFANAQALLGLLSNIRIVDQLLGGLKQDSVVLITGSRIRLKAAESYCVRAQLSENQGGFDGGSFFIDGGNSFDVYLFSSIARAHGLDHREAMDKLVISRAFTPYELKQLVCKDSDEVFRTRQPRLLAVSEIFSLFEHDVEIDEAARITNKIAGSIIRTNKWRRVPIVMTAASVPEHLEKLVDHACNIRAEFIEEEHEITARLLKHPEKPPMEVITETCTGYNQSLLSPLRVTANG